MADFAQEPQAALRLAQWLRNSIHGWMHTDISTVRLSGGSSASLYRIDASGHRAVLRAPQTPARPDSLRALAREARVLQALSTTDVPHPKFMAFCEDSSIIGTPFLLTRWVEGWPGSEPIPLRLRRSETPQQLAFSLVDSLADLHGLDHRRLGLDGFGRPEGFLSRQVDQWLELFSRHRRAGGGLTRELPDVPFIATWLRHHIPPESRAALIHCDASFSNVMFCHDPPPRVAALIDWEIATIGDPLMDIGRALYPFADERGIPGVSMLLDHSSGPTRQALASRYADRTGASIEGLDYYMVLAMFKLAALIEPNYARHVMGLDPSGFSGRIAVFVPELLRGARSIIELQPQSLGVRNG